jgi:general secretion pathway protein L
VSLLRIRISLDDAPLQCEWALIDEAGRSVTGQGSPAELPQRAARVQLVLPAAQVLIARVQLPPAARRRNAALLAYAVEELTVSEPDVCQVSWLGPAGDAEALAVVDKPALERWVAALGEIGIRNPEIGCETLLLPWSPDEWQLCWDGREGYVRNGAFEGGATDIGDRGTPPLALRLLLDEAQARGTRPVSIALQVSDTGVLPDLDAWQRVLGVILRVADAAETRDAHWRSAPRQAGVNLAHPSSRWQVAPQVLARLRPAAWIALSALAIQLTASTFDWVRLAWEQHSLRQGMEAQFRATFPEAVAVADPALQMRRKLAEARQAAGQPDSGDFLPMIGQIAGAVVGLPPGTVRAVSYESGRLSVGLNNLDESGLRSIAARLSESGLNVDLPATSATAPGAAPGTRVLTVRAQ